MARDDAADSSSWGYTVTSTPPPPGPISAPAVRMVDQHTGTTVGDREEYWRDRANEQELRVLELATQLSEALDALKAAQTMLDTMHVRLTSTRNMLDHAIARCDDAP
jgi:hypothetical protein